MSKKKTASQFILDACKVHNSIYSYDEINYYNDHTKIKIICIIHGAFLQTPNSHLSGQGCPNCNIFRRLTTTQFIQKATNIHGEKYIYSNSNYSNNKTKIEIICRIHGPFLQTPNNHLLGKGCPRCKTDKLIGMQTKLIFDFINEANFIHNNIYDYSNSKYTNRNSNIEIICRIHGPFLQTPNSHLRGSGCSKCGNVTSKAEVSWLNSLNIPNDSKHRHITIKINTQRFLVDGFDPITNTIYEFYGDFWHGNPEIFDKASFNKVVKRNFGELYDKTVEREKILVRAGYKVVSIWESDFRRMQKE